MKNGNKKRLSKYQKKLLNEIEEIKRMVFWDARGIKGDTEKITRHLAFDKEMLIRMVILKEHLLVSDFIDFELSNYNYILRKIFDEDMLAELTFKKKYKIFKKIAKAEKNILFIIENINRLRNYLVHQFSPQYIEREKERLLYKGKSIFQLGTLRLFRQDCNKVRQYIHKRLEEYQEFITFLEE